MIALLLLLASAGPPTPTLRPGPLIVTGHTDIDGMAFSPDGATLAVAGQRFDRDKDTISTPIALFDTATGKRTGTLASPGWSTTLLFLPGRLLVFRKEGWDEWHPGRGTRLRSGSLEGERHLLPLWVGSSDERTVTLGGRGEAVVFDMKDGAEVRSVRAADPDALVVPCPTGRLIAATEHQDVDLLDARTGKLVGSLLDHPGAVQGIAFGPGGRLLVARVIGPVGPRKVSPFLRVWDVAAREPLRDIPLDINDDVAVCPRGRFIAVSGYVKDGPGCELRLYTMEGGEVARVRVKPPRYRTLLTFSPDGRRLALAQGGTEVCLFNLSER